MRIFLILLGSIFLIWFAIPAIFLNVFNSGNLVGMIISAMILIYGIWMPGINGWIAGVWQNMPGRFFLSIVAIIATASIIFSAVVTVNIITKAYDRPDCETTVIVLGCQVHPWGPSIMLEERLIAAKEYLEPVIRENVDTLILKEILGHKSISTTEIYTHISNDSLKDAMDASPLANIKNSKVQKNK